MDRFCEYCEKYLIKPRKDQRFCDRRCASNSYRERNTLVENPTPQKARGGVAELIVCADLLKKGYEVFRAVNQHTSCDLIALKDEKTHRIEVKCSRINKSGEVSVSAGVSQKGRYDILALYVFEEADTVIYVPPLP